MRLLFRGKWDKRVFAVSEVVKLSDPFESVDRALGIPPLLLLLPLLVVESYESSESNTGDLSES